MGQTLGNKNTSKEKGKRGAINAQKGGRRTKKKKKKKKKGESHFKKAEERRGGGVGNSKLETKPSTGNSFDRENGKQKFHGGKKKRTKKKKRQSPDGKKKRDATATRGA